MEDMTSKEEFIFLFKSYLKQAKDDVEKWTKHLERLEGDQSALSSPSSEGLGGLLESIESSLKKWNEEGYYGSEQKAYVTGRIDALEEIIDMVQIRIERAA